MQPTFWLNAAPPPHTRAAKFLYGGAAFSQKGGCIYQFPNYNIYYYYYYKWLCHLEKPSLAAFGGFTTVGVCAGIYVCIFIHT